MVTLQEEEVAPAPPAPAARPPAVRRVVRSFAAEDVIELVGSAASSVAIVTIGYYHLLDFSGLLGYLVCLYLTFLVVYGAVTAVNNPRPIVVDRLVATTLYLAAAVVSVALVSTLVYTFAKGWQALSHLNFYTHDMSGV
ncbi:MAG TPA: hypothetical protein VEJ21_02560, partial [Acidimicrobiales bacterium]|nr:hypothetical protein [Acidimicrobiales bacterium]